MMIAHPYLFLTGVALVVYAVGRFQGYVDGHRTECQEWIDEVNRIDVPRWQHIDRVEEDPEKQKLYAKAYCNAYLTVVLELQARAIERLYIDPKRFKEKS